MVHSVEKLMARHGCDVTLVRGAESRTIRAFLQPVSSSSWQSMVPEATVLGQVPQGQYTYLGPATGQVREGDFLLLGEKRYLLLRVETYRWENTPIYQWGLCVEGNGEETWGT